MSELRRQLASEIEAHRAAPPEDTHAGWAAWYQRAADLHARLASWRGRGHLVACSLYEVAAAKHELAGNPDGQALCLRLASAVFRCDERNKDAP